jgi:hypothetical protein
MNTVQEKGGKPGRKPYPLSYDIRNPDRNLKSENSQDYAQTSTRFYVHEFGFCPPPLFLSPSSSPPLPIAPTSLVDYFSYPILFAVLSIHGQQIESLFIHTGIQFSFFGNR